MLLFVMDKKISWIPYNPLKILPSRGFLINVHIQIRQICQNNTNFRVATCRMLVISRLELCVFITDSNPVYFESNNKRYHTLKFSKQLVISFIQYIR